MKKVILLLLSMLLPLAANPLKPYQWKKRILLVQSNEAFEDLRKHAAALSERDLIILRLSPRKTPLPNEIPLTKKERQELRDRYKVNEKEPATFILIGKDGGEKARQTKKLDLAKFFALIDTMPMRKAEMKK